MHKKLVIIFIVYICSIPLLAQKECVLATSAKNDFQAKMRRLGQEFSKGKKWRITNGRAEYPVNDQNNFLKNTIQELLSLKIQFLSYKNSTEASAYNELIHTELRLREIENLILKFNLAAKTNSLPYTRLIKLTTELSTVYSKAVSLSEIQLNIKNEQSKKYLTHTDYPMLSLDRHYFSKFEQSPLTIEDFIIWKRRSDLGGYKTFLGYFRNSQKDFLRTLKFIPRALRSYLENLNNNFKADMSDQFRIYFTTKSTSIESNLVAYLNGIIVISLYPGVRFFDGHINKSNLSFFMHDLNHLSTMIRLPIFSVFHKNLVDLKTSDKTDEKFFGVVVQILNIILHEGGVPKNLAEVTKDLRHLSATRWLQKDLFQNQNIEMDLPSYSSEFYRAKSLILSWIEEAH